VILGYSIAKEGYKSILIFLAFFAVAAFVDFFEYLFLALLISSILIFRKKEQINTTFDKETICAPISGVVQSVQTIMHSEQNVKFIKITIDKRLTDQGELFACSDMQIQKIIKTNGLHIAPSSQVEYLKKKVLIEGNSSKGLILWKISSGFIPFDTRFYYHQNELRCGESVGFMVDGQISLFLPQNAKIITYGGQNIQGGQTILGYLS
jgi:phosphatidylserine decarboxylase